MRAKEEIEKRGRGDKVKELTTQISNNAVEETIPADEDGAERAGDEDLRGEGETARSVGPAYRVTVGVNGGSGPASRR